MKRNSEKNQIFLQVRIGSSRLPEKALLKIRGKTMVELIIERLRKVKDIDKIILVTGKKKINAPLIEETKRLGIDYFQGSEENVLDRFYRASLKFRPDNIIRIGGDCPLIDFNLINKGLKIFKKGNYDILSNCRVRTFPQGLDFEIFTTQALKLSWQEHFKEFKNKKEEFDKTFINPTNYLRKGKKFKNKDLINNLDLSGIRIVLDYKEDFQLIKKIYENLYQENKYFSTKEILNFLKVNPNLLKLNQKYI